ncbi:MAG: HypC/HybG/HupF family hydrogenase formation chaperone [Actinobacteria bacterium]|nr:HypC/HybG/HupF family hydrogenase formation chaperone [Actinomycetota bacterium]
MCLGIPGKIINIRDDGFAEIDMGGNIKEAGLQIVPEAKLGDYVLIHAGYAIQVLSEEEALETLDYLRQIASEMGAADETG